MINFCTLFNSHYLSRGLNLYNSLINGGCLFHLYIYAFDELSYQVLIQMKLPRVTVIHLSEFEDPELLAVKDQRTVGEYCWTCTPSVIKHAIETYNLPSCTYLDADLYFFSNPNVLLEEVGDNSIIITEHRYTKKYNQVEESGVYCVQFMFFKNDYFGMKALNWWRKSCIDWCFARHENGKFGDQKYLDDWLTRFDKVHVLRNLGGGVAPWNVQQYNLEDDNFKVIFYHFHGLKIFNDKKVFIGNYEISNKVIDFIYKPYLRDLNKIELMLESKFDFYKRKLSFSNENIGFKTLIKNILNYLNLRNNNVIYINKN